MGMACIWPRYASFMTSCATSLVGTAQACFEFLSRSHLRALPSSPRSAASPLTGNEDQLTAVAGETAGKDRPCLQDIEPSEEQDACVVQDFTWRPEWSSDETQDLASAAGNGHDRCEATDDFCVKEEKPRSGSDTCTTRSRGSSDCDSSGCSDMETDTLQRKLIFLDIDGPIAPWSGDNLSIWDEYQSLTDEPYQKHLTCLLRIIHRAGGPDVVKVIISSNWRTDGRKYPWLVSDLRKHGIDVLGHTDVVYMHPQKTDSHLHSRHLEVQRALHFRSLGSGGPLKDKDGKKTFIPVDIPKEWDITHWIVIDDIQLDKVEGSSFEYIVYHSSFLKYSEDDEVGNGWIRPPAKFVQTMSDWLNDFTAAHFVQVGAETGIGGTPGAEDQAVRLLGSE